MTSEPRVIDLGEYGFAPDPVPERVPLPVRWRAWWHRRRWRVRGWTLVVLAAGLMVSHTTAGALVEPQLRQVWTIPDAAYLRQLGFLAFAVQDGRFFLLDRDRLAAYRLRDGRMQWEVGLGEVELNPRARLGVGVYAGLAVVTLNLGSSSRTTAYETDTGRPRWSRPGTPHRMSDELFLLLDRSSGPGARGQPIELAVLDPATGRITDGLRVPFTATRSVAYWESPAGTTYLFELDRDGELSRVGLANGFAAERIQTPHAERESRIRQNQLWLAGGLLLVRTLDLLAAYDPVTLTHRWTIPGGSDVTPCGDLLCVSMRTDADQPAAGGWPEAAVHAVDPATGERRWSVECAGATPVEGTCGFLGLRELEPDGRLWMEPTYFGVSPTGSYAGGWVADTETGEAMAGPVRWSLSGQLEGSAELLLRRDEEPPETGRAAGSGQHRIWWARSDPQLSTVNVLGEVTARECSHHHPYLVCWTSRDAEVWRIAG